MSMIVSVVSKGILIPGLAGHGGLLKDTAFLSAMRGAVNCSQFDEVKVLVSVNCPNISGNTQSTKEISKT